MLIDCPPFRKSSHLGDLFLETFVMFLTWKSSEWQVYSFGMVMLEVLTGTAGCGIFVSCELG